MKPLRLTLQALGPYAGRQIIDFRAALDSGLFGIYGSTGSGKSTIFSAMTFALFGEATNKDQVANSLRSDHADPGLMTEVELVFELGGKQYRIVRWPEQVRPSKRGGGETEEKHKAWLFDVTGMDLSAIDDANPGKVLAEGKVTLVDAKVIELLGYGATQFRQIILLPQGKFETFLTAKTEDRLKILRDLFDVSLYRRLADKLKEDARAAEDMIRTKRTVCDGRLLAEGFDSRDALSSGIEAAITRQTELTKAAGTAKAKLDAEEKAFQTAAKTDAAFAEHLDAEKAVRDLDSQREPIAALSVRLAGARIVQSLVDVDAAVSAARQKAEQSVRLHGEAVTAHRSAAGASAKAAEKLKALDAKRSDVEALRARRRDYESHGSKLAESLSLRTILGEAEGRARTASEVLRKAREHHAALDRSAPARHRGARRGARSRKRASVSGAPVRRCRSGVQSSTGLREGREPARKSARRVTRRPRPRTSKPRANSNSTRNPAASPRPHCCTTTRNSSPASSSPARHAPSAVRTTTLPPRVTPPRMPRAAKFTSMQRPPSTQPPLPKPAPASAWGSRRHSLRIARRSSRTHTAGAIGTRPSRASRRISEPDRRARRTGRPCRHGRATNRSLEAKIAEAITALEQARTHASACETAHALARQSLDDALKAVPPNLRQPDALQAATKLLDDEISRYDEAAVSAELCGPASSRSPRRRRARRRQCRQEPEGRRSPSRVRRGRVERPPGTSRVHT